MHLLPPLIDDKRGELEGTPRLAALAKRVTELRDVYLQACHHIEEFTLWWIHPLGHRDKPAFECPRLADPSRDPNDSKISVSFICCC
jgi:hypothetical protein